MDEHIQKETVLLYRRALITEITGLLVLQITTWAENKMKLRSTLTANLTYGKSELSSTLTAEEQTLTILSLLPNILMLRVSAGVKLK